MKQKTRAVLNVPYFVLYVSGFMLCDWRLIKFILIELLSLLLKQIKSLRNRMFYEIQNSRGQFSLDFPVAIENKMRRVKHQNYQKHQNNINRGPRQNHITSHIYSFRTQILQNTVGDLQFLMRFPVVSGEIVRADNDVICAKIKLWYYERARGLDEERNTRARLLFICGSTCFYYFYRQMCPPRRG